MIEAVYRRMPSGAYRVTVQGHGGGKLGQDLTCAAATILLYTLREDWRRMKEAGMAGGYEETLRDGYAELTLRAKPKWRATVEAMTGQVLAGYAILAELEPEKVQFARK